MIEKFSAFLYEQQRSQNTVNTYVKAAEQYMKWYGETFSVPLLQILKSNVAEYVSYLTNVVKLVGTEASSTTWFAVMFTRLIKSSLLTMRSNNSVTASRICCVEEECLPRFAVPCACFGTARP